MLNTNIKNKQGNIQPTTSQNHPFLHFLGGTLPYTLQFAAPASQSRRWVHCCTWRGRSWCPGKNSRRKSSNDSALKTVEWLVKLSNKIIPLTNPWTYLGSPFQRIHKQTNKPGFYHQPSTERIYATTTTAACRKDSQGLIVLFQPF